MSEKFTIKLMGVVFESDESGMLDLNLIHKGCDLHNNKRPSQWRGKVKEDLERCADLHTVNGDKGYTKGNEFAVVNYAMWFSLDFHRIVVDAFVALRKGDVQKALALASETMSDSDSHYLKRQMKLKGMLFDESCAYAGIKHSRLCKKMLLSKRKPTKRGTRLVIKL